MGAVAFLCAMPMELQPLVRRLSLRRADVGGVDAHVGSLRGSDVVAVTSGMGTTLAREATERLLDAVDVSMVTVVGIAGAVDDATPIGSVVVPDVVIDGATGAEHRPAPLAGLTPRGAMWTTDALLTGADVLAALRARGVVALDMETAAVAEVCERRGVPWSVVRAVSDRAGDPAVDDELFRLVDQRGRPRPRAVARYVTRHPQRIPALVRLGRGSRRAREAAASTAIRACSVVAS